MRHIVETGTDVAQVCFFDPAALPADFDTQLSTNSLETFQKLSKSGLFWWKETGADGAYLFHFYVNSEIPSPVKEHLEDPQKMDLFRVVSGTIWACGVEYAALNPAEGRERRPKGGLAKNPHMGGNFEIPAGEYSLTAWRTEWPEEMLQEALEKVLGKDRVKREQRIGRMTGAFFFVTVISTFVLLIAAARLASLKSLWAAAVVAGLWFVLLRLFKVCRKMEASGPRREIEHEFPSIVVQLISKPKS